MNWRDISYLSSGDKNQKEVFLALSKSRVLKFLAAFDPVLTGTYPIGIYLPDSDLDRFQLAGGCGGHIDDQ